MLLIAYTDRRGRIRLISARRATKREQDDYFQQNT
ncbi:MAG: BrnT family toxin [Deltaproteobacteria bacterium]|nr:BrnT family toxin [Deltaproteobacteria bacterium]